mgnify:FL=1|jgi:hypothetical protein
MSDKLENIFKIQLINLFNDLLIVFLNDSFLLELKLVLEDKIKHPDFFKNLDYYFSKEVEECVNNKDEKILFRTNYTFIPTSKEDIIKIRLLNYWKTLSNKNKDKVWGYLNILLQIYNKVG